MTSSSNKHVPLRSCSVCRVKAAKSELIRIVKSPDGQAVIDIAGKLDGRGAYICPDSDCIEKGRKSGSLARVLGVKNINPEFWAGLEDYAKNHAVNNDLKLRSVLGLARKAGALLIGVDNIKGSHRKVLVITATDCSDSVSHFAESYTRITNLISISELSEAAGSRNKNVQIAALPLSSGFAKKALTLSQNNITEIEGRTAFE